MKLKPILLFAVIASATLGGWWVGQRESLAPSVSTRKVLFYQSPMHPWIKSERPGNCTICGMKLVAVYEGDKALDSAVEPGGVRLSQQSINVLHVETSKVLRQPLRRALRVAGTIDDDDSRHRRLSAYVDGRIDKLLVNTVGAEVTAGQPLALIFSNSLLAVRDEYLLLRQQTGAAQRERLLLAARDRLLRMGLSARQIESLGEEKNPSDLIEILAPVSGTVVERKVYAGQYVKEGDVLFEVADFSTMWFVFDVYERDLAWLRMGQIVDVSTVAVPGKVFSAPITFIDPNLMNETRSVKIRVVLENPLVDDPGKHRHELLHKVYAEAIVHVSTPETLVVPRSAVLAPGAEPLVYVARGDSTYEPRRVRLGRAGDEFWEVLDGLSEGESVVTTGNLLIDSQSQLEKGVADLPLVTPSKPLNGLQREAARAFFAGVDALSTALAGDSLTDFNGEAARLHGLVDALSKAFGADVQKITLSGHIAPAQNLADARKAFYMFSAASAQFASGLRTQDPGFSKLKVFECPMAKVAVPSAASDKGQWVQLAAPSRNPFFGKEMLDCGTEVKP